MISALKKIDRLLIFRLPDIFTCLVNISKLQANGHSHHSF